MTIQNNRSTHRNGLILMIALLSFLFSNCYSFKKGYHRFKDGQFKEAAKIFKKKTNHPVWGGPAKAYGEYVKLKDARTLAVWQHADTILCSVLKELDSMPRYSKKRQKWNKYEVNPTKLESTLANVQRGAMETVRGSGQIADLFILLERFPCWQHQDSLQKFIDERVNTTICCSPEKSDLSCNSLLSGSRWDITYDNATLIINHYADRVKPENFELFLNIKNDIWQIFREQSPPYCAMDRFRSDHPDHPYLEDCSYTAASHALCSDSLKVALAFFNQHPQSIFDRDVCNRILCLLSHSKEKLSETEQQQVRDIELMTDLRYKMCADKIGDTIRFFQDMENLSRKCHSHQVVFELAQLAVNFFLQREQPDNAKNLIKKIAPFFVDPSTCQQYDLQTGKQEWFQRYLRLLHKPDPSPTRRAKPITTWNTKEYDEFSAVSWGDGNEAYFVRRDDFLESNSIMYSKLNGETWSAPSRVSELSFAPDAEPISITDDGRMLLLRSEGKIWQSIRRNTSLLWSRPEPLPLNLQLASWAALSSDGNTLLVEGISNRNRPVKDIFLCKIGKNGRFGKPEKLKAPINFALSNEMRPYITANGRSLYLTSDRPDGMGGTDNYVVSLPESFEFTNPDSPATHLNWRFNTWNEDFGFTFISDYTGKGFFHRSNLCGHNMDIFEITIPLPPPPPCDTLENDSIKCPKPILRFAGVILDEHHVPIAGDEGSFVEFITDYDLHATKRLISEYGTYVYTAPSKARAVRLFPEIPGYYSERDVTHFPAMLSRDTIIRDTFILTSFEHIRDSFLLKYGTFYHQTAEFDDKDRVYPEMVRLAKIARRMGAELEIHGHTDSTGTHIDNDVLSKQRANAVKSFLVKTCGFEEEKITTKGFGSKKPKCPNTSEEGLRCNRRVEVIFKMPELPIRKTPSTEASPLTDPSPTIKH